MTDYNFYRNSYMGESIEETDFPRLIKRAGDQLAQYKRIYTVFAPEGEIAEKMALCAMAEAMHNAEVVASGEGSIQSAAIGSVSTSYRDALTKAVDVTPDGVARAVFDAARLYLDIYAGVF